MQASKLKSVRSQAGFTLIEMMVVFAIIGILIGVANSGLFQSQEDSKIMAAQTSLSKDFPSVITRIRTMTGKCNNTNFTKEKMIERGAPNETVWGTDWSVTTSGGNRVVLTYTLDTIDTEAGTRMATKLLEDKNIVAAEGSSSSVSVTYRCN